MQGTQTANAIDWTIPVTPPRWLPNSTYVTLAMCRDLRKRMTTSSEAAALDAQINDECRHIEIYRQYLERLGDIALPEPALDPALEGQFVWSGSPLGTVVAVHLLIESEGLRVQREFGRWFPCALLRRAHESISPDEARHITFGRRTVAAGIASISPEERIEIYCWLEGLWRSSAQATQAELPGIIRHTMGRHWIDDRWTRHRCVLIKTGLVDEEEARRAA
jgi:hypothetical protein